MDYAVHGTDVSKYQTSIDWHKAKANGVSFAFIKATEGGDRIDSYFDEHWAGPRQPAYHAQRLSFLLFLPARRGTGALVHRERAERPLGHAARPRHGVESGFADLQAEARAGDGAQRDAHLPVDRRKALRQEADHLHVGGFLRRQRSQKLPRLSLLAALGRRPPDDKYASHPFTFWQYTGTGVVPGIRGNADINVFNGNTPPGKSGWRPIRARSPVTQPLRAACEM